MRLAEMMSSPVETVAFDEMVSTASEKMRRLRIHHLVVLDGRSVVGVLSARDLVRRAGDGRTPVEEVMSGGVVTAGPDTSLREAANLLRGRGVGCIPVVEKGKPVGIVTIADVLELIGKGSVRPVEMGKRWTLKHRGPRRTNERSGRGR